MLKWSMHVLCGFMGLGRRRKLTLWRWLKTGQKTKCLSGIFKTRGLCNVWNWTSDPSCFMVTCFPRKLCGVGSLDMGQTERFNFYRDSLFFLWVTWDCRTKTPQKNKKQNNNKPPTKADIIFYEKGLSQNASESIHVHKLLEKSSAACSKDLKMYIFWYSTIPMR